MIRDKKEIEICWKALENKMEKLKFTENEKNHLKNKLLKEEANGLRMHRIKLTADDFEPVEIIGRGAFGEVRVCRKKDTG
jgi:serine/threonine kinase 38